MSQDQSAGNQSDVARLLRQIDLEYEAVQRGLTGLALGTFRHAFINAKMERISECHAQLITLMGEDKANDAVLRINDASFEQQSVKKEASV